MELDAIVTMDKGDSGRREEFYRRCRKSIFLNKHFKDESIINFNNRHYWVEENPHLINGEIYENFLRHELPVGLEDVPLVGR